MRGCHLKSGGLHPPGGLYNILEQVVAVLKASATRADPSGRPVGPTRRPMGSACVARARSVKPGTH